MIQRLVGRRLSQIRLSFKFSDEKKEGDAMTTKELQNELKDAKSILKRRFSGQVKIEQKFLEKTSGLYDRYMNVRQKPVLCNDGCLLAYEFVIERLPIFKPYLQRSFQVARNRYFYAKKTGFYLQLPKQLRLENGDNPFKDYDEVNEQNEISHQIVLSKTEKISYRQNSRLWRYVDPNIFDPHSIQTNSSEHVFLIVKQKGKWKFPSKILSQKETHQAVLSSMIYHLFQGTKYPVVHYPSNKPLSIRKSTFQGQEKQVRVLTFKAISIFGIPQFPTKDYEDFAWVSKPLLAKYFEDTYFGESAWTATHSVY